MTLQEEMDRKYIRELQTKVEELERQLDEMSQRADTWKKMYQTAVQTLQIAGK